MRVIFIVASLLGLVATLLPAPVAQEKRGSISGTIVGLDSRIVPGAKISVVRRKEERGNNADEFTKHSDEKGAFKFESLPIGNYELEVIPPDMLLLRKFTTSITVRDSENTTAEIRLQRLQQCDGETLRDLTQTDQAEIVRFMLDEALTKKEIPSYRNLVVGNEAILSTKNIDSQRPSNPPDLKLLLLSPEDVQRRANQKGDLMYLEFEKIKIEGSCVAVQLCNFWADGTSTIETGKKTFLGEGCLYYVFHKQPGKWAADFVTGWISD